jgi:dynactin-4
MVRLFFFSEYNPASIKFKIQLAAYYHIPEIKVFRVPAPESLVPGKGVEFLIKIINPTQHATFIEILDLVTMIGTCFK